MSFTPKFPPFIATCIAASHTFNKKSFTQRVFLVKKVKNISEMEWNSFVCFRVDKGNGREPVKQLRKGKNRMRRKLLLCFLSELLCHFTYIHLSSIVYWEQTGKVIPLFCTAHPLLHITLRHPRWRRFFPLERKEQTRAPFAELKLLFAKIMPQIGWQLPGLLSQNKKMKEMCVSLLAKIQWRLF